MEEDLAISEAARKALEHRKYILREFIETEREYVKRLEIALEDYFLHIKLASPETASLELKNDIVTIFSTLPDIFAFHKNVFLPEMESCDWQTDADAIMDCFMKHQLDFHVYLPYCKNKPASDGLRVEHESYFTQRRHNLNQKLDIEDLLIAPVQRLPKYQLLIRDLLKYTKRAQLNTSKIEEALELMMKIPRETNNIICMSLLRGMSRANILSHGSLWRQNSLIFSCTSTKDNWNPDSFTCNAKNEPKQVFLFDHRILVADPANADGFFEYCCCLKTLNGRLSEDEDNPCLFSFTTESGVTGYLKASSPSGRAEWVKDIRSILDSQEQMKKALIFGKSAAGLAAVRMHSLSVEWSDSDSSVDSMPSSGEEEDEEEDDDWPEERGFQNVNKPGKNLTVPSLAPPPKNSNPKLSPMLHKKKGVGGIGSKFRSVSLDPSLESKSLKLPKSPLQGKGLSKGVRRGTEPVIVTDSTNRPVSCTLDSLSQFDQSMQRKSNALSISPRMLRSWVARKSSSQAKSMHIYFPTKSQPAFEKFRTTPTKDQDCACPTDVLFIALDDLPGVAPQLYTPQPGQVFMAEDTSQGEVWKVKALSGGVAGDSVWVQRNCLEEYSAPISLRTLKKNYRVLNTLSGGRFSKVKLAKSRTSPPELHALKMLDKSTTEEQFYRELCIGARMRHKSLVGYLTGLQHPNAIGIAMQYINGHHLLDYLANKSTVTEKMVMELMKQLLEGLHYMHSHTILHLDIRPENLMVDLPSEQLKIIDYGAARHLGDVDEVLSQNFETCSNYEFVAPEIFQQVPVGPGTDIWGVGLVMYTIFYGYTPFSGESPVRVIANITGQRYTFSGNNPPPCTIHALKLVKDILVLIPSQRPTAKAATESSWMAPEEEEELQSKKVNLQPLKLYLSKHKSKHS